MRFSALHELAHHLLDVRDLLIDLYELPNHRAIEEAICDEFAASVLIPATTVDRHIDPAGPTAQAIISLYNDPNVHASRACCCVAAANRLTGEGYVMLGDLDGVARFTAPHATNLRVANDTPQGSDSIISKAARIGTKRGEGSVQFRSGATSDTFHADAGRDGEYVFSVFASGTPPWGGLSLLPARRMGPARDRMPTMRRGLRSPPVVH